MIKWFKDSLKKINNEKRQKEDTKTEVSELQDAVLELADLVNTVMDNNEVRHG